MTTHWYPETVDLYFSGQYRDVNHGVMEELLHKRIIARAGDKFIASLPE